VFVYQRNVAFDKTLTYMTATIVSLICCAIGGNLGGLVLKKFSLGPLWNSVVGIVGGGIGGQVLGMFGLGGGNEIVGGLASGGVGGMVLMVIVGLIKKAMSK
jgi:uncharacterized membrane protein YeaQ/YmgE (transglycosylase-associated protein family)